MGWVEVVLLQLADLAEIGNGVQMLHFQHGH